MASKKAAKKVVPRVRPPLKRAVPREDLDERRDEMKGWDAEREATPGETRAHDLAEDMGNRWQDAERFRSMASDAEEDRQALYHILREHVFSALEGRLLFAWDVNKQGHLSMQVTACGMDGRKVVLPIGLEEVQALRDWLIRHAGPSE